MSLQAQLRWDTSRVFHGEDETQLEGECPSFCKEIRDFKNFSRNFHEFFAEADGAHYPRSLEPEGCDLEIIVRDACQYPKRYEGRDDLSNDQKAGYTAIVNEILAASKKMVGNRRKVTLEIVFLTVYIYSTKEKTVLPLFKVYGNGRDEFVFISKEREKYKSLSHFLDKCDLPHSLVCAPREGSEKTYEIDRVIKKYPLVFFTVNYLKGMSKGSVYSMLSTAIYKDGVPVEIPFFSIWALARDFCKIVIYQLYKVICDMADMKSLRRKFSELAERIKNIPCGTWMNWIIILAVGFACCNGFIDNNRLATTLMLNSSESIIKIGQMGQIISEGVLHNSCPCYRMGEKYPFISNCEGSRVESVVEELDAIGREVLQIFSNDLKFKCIYAVIKVGVLTVRYLIRSRDSKRKPSYYLEERTWGQIPKSNDGDYSLNNFLKTYKKKDIANLISDEKYVRQHFGAIFRRCPPGDEQYSPLIPFPGDADAYLSLTPTSETIENLLEKSHKNASVYASEDNSLYEISSEGTLYKIYPFKNDKSHKQIKQFIRVEKEQIDFQAKSSNSVETFPICTDSAGIVRKSLPFLPRGH